jgi:hypothetical protein
MPAIGTSGRLFAPPIPDRACKIHRRGYVIKHNPPASRNPNRRQVRTQVFPPRWAESSRRARPSAEVPLRKRGRDVGTSGRRDVYRRHPRESRSSVLAVVVITREDAVPTLARETAKRLGTSCYVGSRAGEGRRHASSPGPSGLRGSSGYRRVPIFLCPVSSAATDPSPNSPLRRGKICPRPS